MISIYKKTGELALMADTTMYNDGGWLRIEADLSDCDLSPLANYFVELTGCNLDGADLSQLDFRYVVLNNSIRWSQRELAPEVVQSLSPLQISQAISADVMFTMIHNKYVKDSITQD